MKLKLLQKNLREKAVDVVLFFNNDANLTYFAGVKPNIACLAVPVSGKPVLFVPGFEADRMSKLTKLKVVQIKKDFFGTVQKKFPGKKVGLVASSVSHAYAQKVKATWKAKLVNVEDKCRDLRVVKTNEEVKRIKKACDVTHLLFEDLCRNLHRFKTELDAAAFMKLRMAQLGFEPSFPAIVASGKNGAVPHHIPSKSKLSGFTVFDFGVVYRNYCSDMTRTVFVGNPTSKDKKVYGALLRVQNDCIKRVTPGRNFSDIDSFAKKAVGKTMLHNVGHSLGIEVHDMQPRPLHLQEGNVITIEPGTYHPRRFGIRIEDDVLVTKKGPVILTRTPKNFRAFRR
jgi:Xaa-Pro aminopeptidase